jgi:hypothetical protein
MEEGDDMRAMAMMGVAAALVFTTAPVEGQRGGPGSVRMDRDRGRVVSPLERQVERALARRDALGLSEAQVSELETLRSEIERSLEPMRSEGRELRSEARDRSGDPDEVRARMQDLRTRNRALRARSDTVLAGLQERFEQAVPPLQRRELARPNGRDGRAGAVRGAPGRGGDRLQRDRGVRGGAGVARRDVRVRGAGPAVVRGRAPAATARARATGSRSGWARTARDARWRRIGRQVG